MSRAMDRNQILSRRAIEGMIAQGHTIVIFEGQVLKLDSWMEKHPGGKLPLLQMVGVDASSEIAA
jgi:delta8-fatty-acid desaturase